MSTLKQLRDSVIDDLDLGEEDFVNDADLNRWINKGVRKAERAIHNLYEDYFLSHVEVNISLGDQYIDYPSDIYANKVRKIIYQDGSSNSTSQHVVNKVKDLARALERDIFNSDTVTPILQWSPYNSAADGRKIRIFPKTGRDGKLTIFYIRNAKELVNDNDECDIDEFEDFITEYTKLQVALKDKDLTADDYKVLEEELLQDLTNTLSDMSPDGDNSIEADRDHYDDSVGGEC